MLKEQLKSASQSKQYLRKSRLIGGAILVICVVISALLVISDEPRTKIVPQSNSGEGSEMNFAVDNNDDMPLMVELREDHETTLGNGWNDISLSKLSSSGKCWKIVRERCFSSSYKHCDHFDGKYFKPTGLLTEDNEEDDDHAKCVDVNGDGRCDYSTETVEGCHNTCLLHIRSHLSDTIKCGAYLQSKSNSKKECYCVLGTIGECCQNYQPCSGTSNREDSGAVFR